MIVWAAMLSTLAVQVHGAAPIYVGTDSGLYKSTDAGMNWKQVNVPLTGPLLSGQLDVLAVRKDPQNPSTIYLIGLAKAWAFFATHDGGQTWTATPFQGISPTAMGMNGLEVDFAGQVIYITASTAGTSASLLYKSTDVGLTWRQVKIPTVSFSPAVRIVADPLVSGTIYSLTGNDEFFKSTDFGGSWTKIGGPSITQTSGGVVPQTTILNIKVDPRNPLIWYFGTDHNAFPETCPLTNGGLCGLFKSTDGGATFTGLSIPINYVSSVSFGAVSSTVYATGNVAGLGPTLMRSTDSGGTWTALVNGLFTAQSGEVWADPTDPSAIYVDDNVYSNTSFYVSTDGGATFPQRATPVGPPTCVPGNCARQPINDLLFVPPSGPVIDAVVNGASFLAGIAPSTWITIYGTGLSGTTRSWGGADFVNGNLPTALDQVSAKVDGLPAYVYYISPTQLNVLSPDDSTTGPVQVQVTTIGGTSGAFTVNTSPVSPALFLFAPKYPAAVHVSGQSVGPVGLIAGANFAPAKPGETIEVFGTGFGSTAPPLPASKLVTHAEPLVRQVSVTIGGQPADVAFAGVTGAGLDQINVTIPTGLPDGDAALTATVDGSSVQTNLFIAVHH